MSIQLVLKNKNYYQKECAPDSSAKLAIMDRYLGNLGKRVQQLREDFGWNQTDLAKKMTRAGAKMSQPGVGHIETGIRLPSPAALIALAQVLEVSTDYILGVSDDPTTPVNVVVPKSQRALDRLFGQLSPERQDDLVAITRTLVEQEKSPPVDDYDKIIMAAIEFVEAYDEEVAMRLLDLLDSTSPVLSRHIALRRRQQTLDE